MKKNLLFRSFVSINTPNACFQTHWSQNDLIYQQRQEEVLHDKYLLSKPALSRLTPPQGGAANSFPLPTLQYSSLVFKSKYWAFGSLFEPKGSNPHLKQYMQPIFFFMIKSVHLQLDLASLGLQPFSAPSADKSATEFLGWSPFIFFTISGCSTTKSRI